MKNENINAQDLDIKIKNDCETIVSCHINGYMRVYTLRDVKNLSNSYSKSYIKIKKLLSFLFKRNRYR